jgi:hypothetical protein
MGLLTRSDEDVIKLKEKTLKISTRSDGTSIELPNDYYLHVKCSSVLYISVDQLIQTCFQTNKTRLHVSGRVLDVSPNEAHWTSSRSLTNNLVRTRFGHGPNAHVSTCFIHKFEHQRITKKLEISFSFFHSLRNPKMLFTSANFELNLSLAHNFVNNK